MLLLTRAATAEKMVGAINIGTVPFCYTAISVVFNFPDSTIISRKIQVVVVVSLLLLSGAKL
ncbi:hypothetical protein KDK_26840 [Dictyobacter kobayashii]|uniref:Uncharacterized protein n=1 Tax=Dictyobacter kobayashii TaxID=2014872 RepID=A0A402AIK5_9CHLR|nr:hypothetical protein KDK_26840 [Dictyobacter kobayashii]